MKSIFLFLLLMIVTGIFRAQAQDLFGQDGKMIANNAVQIGLLKTYSGYMDKGLSLAQNGLDLTHSYKNGEFGLHDGYYTSLMQVNQNVKKYPAAQSALDLYAKMKTLQTAIKSNISNTAFLSVAEKSRLTGTLTNLMDASGKDMDELGNLLTDGKYQLSDNERMTRIEAVYKRIQIKYRSLSNFQKQVNTVTSGRKEQKANATKMKQLYGLP